MISIIIPIYNAESCLDELLFRLQKVVADISEPAEIILLDDASSDGSLLKLKEYDSSSNLRIFASDCNRGQIATLCAGFRQALGDTIVTLDCDLQHPPELIPQLVLALQAPTQAVIGVSSSRNYGLLRRLTRSIFFKSIQLLSRRPIRSDLTTFTSVSRKAIERYLVSPYADRIYVNALRQLDIPIRFFEFERAERFNGKSSYSIKKLIGLATTLVRSTAVR